MEQNRGRNSSMRIVITDHGYPDPSLEQAICARHGIELLIGNARSEADVLALAMEAEAVVTRYAPVSARVVEGLRRCRVIGRYGTGLDNVDVEAATRRGIRVVNVRGYATREVAQHTLALALALIRRLPVYAESVRAGRWDWEVGRPIWAAEAMVYGVVGCGEIGRAVAGMAAGLGFRVVAYDPWLPEALRPVGVEFTSLESLLAAADVVSLHVPLTRETTHLIGRRELARMRPTAVLVNTSRGRVVDEAALVEALRSGRISGAGLDVLEQEPPAPNHPLLELPNVIVTPHVAWYSEESMRRLRVELMERVVQALWETTGEGNRTRDQRCANGCGGGQL